MTRVALIGPADREELIRLALRLEERDARAVILDSRMDPRISISGKKASACGVDLSDIAGIYVADLGLRSPVALGEDGQVDLRASEKALVSSRRHLAAWNSLLAHLSLGCPVVNPPQTHDLHSLKPWECAEYAREGIPVPLTISTSDARVLMELQAGDFRGDGIMPDEVHYLRPREGASREWIRKGMAGGYGYTEAFAPPLSMEEAEAALKNGPVMIQERVMGDNVRAFVLDGEMIGAAEVVSREAEETDSRRGEMRLRRAALDPQTSQLAIMAAECHGLCFAAVDLMVDARTRKYFVLECNSAPFFVNFERMSGHPISSRLADYLAGRSRTRTPDGRRVRYLRGFPRDFSREGGRAAGGSPRS